MPLNDRRDRSVDRSTLVTAEQYQICEAFAYPYESSCTEQLSVTHTPFYLLGEGEGEHHRAEGQRSLHNGTCCSVKA